MTYSWTFLVVAIALVLTPGADFAVIVRNTVTGGRRVGTATTLGVGTAAALQGLLVSFGLARFIVRAHPVFLALVWAGIGYLTYLAASSLLSAIRGNYPPTEAGQRSHSTCHRNLTRLVPASRPIDDAPAGVCGPRGQLSG